MRRIEILRSIRRLGCIAMNGIVEMDIYGNVNSTHLSPEALAWHQRYIDSGSMHE